MNRIITSISVAAHVGMGLLNLSAQERKPNVLFLAVDDLKPILGCYGDTTIRTPNIDLLAARATVFTQSYCQQAVCGPTRASLLTGLRPDKTRVWDLKTQMRAVNPNIVSLPQYFIERGYSTQGIGKIYDPRCVDASLDAPSWSVPYYKKSTSYFPKGIGAPEGEYQLPTTKELIRKARADGEARALDSKALSEFVQQRVRPSVECLDVPDHAYTDGANALHARDILGSLAKEGKPFFFAVGFSKPHLPFVAPKKYWDLYKRETLPLAPYRKQAKNSPDLAYHRASELYAYSDIPSISSFTDHAGGGLDIPLEKQRELIHGYYASVSYTDAQVGILLRALDSLGLTGNTIVVLWGDHGWHLGDHNLWCKHTNFEQATHAPLLIAAPGMAASRSSSPVEFVDIFPTLCDLAGVSIPVRLDGKSLVPIMKDPKIRVKEFAISQYPRTQNGIESARLGYSDGEYMGYSMRTDRYRYTLWLSEMYRSGQPFKENLVVARELYDYQQDPNETENVAAAPAYSTIAGSLHRQLVNFLNTQETTIIDVPKNQK